MNNKLLSECRQCSEVYCYNCSGNDYNWKEFCSKKCEDEYKKESKNKIQSKTD